jgi:hypothetical protein
VAKIRTVALAISIFGLTLLAGCGGRYYAGAAFGPPAPIIESPFGVAPGPGYIWTDGYYDWEGGHYVWRHGTWRRRPRPHAEWIRPHWERHGDRYRFREGHWR